MKLALGAGSRLDHVVSEKLRGEVRAPVGEAAGRLRAERA
jgi:hypothetical protein